MLRTLSDLPRHTSGHTLCSSQLDSHRRTRLSTAHDICQLGDAEQTASDVTHASLRWFCNSQQEKRESTVRHRWPCKSPSISEALWRARHSFRALWTQPVLTLPSRSARSPSGRRREAGTHPQPGHHITQTGIRWHTQPVSFPSQMGPEGLLLHVWLYGFS